VKVSADAGAAVSDTSPAHTTLASSARFRVPLGTARRYSAAATVRPNGVGPGRIGRSLCGASLRAGAGPIDDPFALHRFIEAQDRGDTYQRAVGELRAGRKRSHWMWFVFPQFAGLGNSATSRTYAISSLEEARAYLAHPVLGARLLECARILTELDGPTATELLGHVDALKLRSSMTLFACAAPRQAVFADVLAAYFDGAVDSATETLLDALGGR
jgi:uncharacterized protein (DUF1810 family)